MRQLLETFATENNEALCLEAGMDKYLSKPLDMEKIVEILNNMEKPLQETL